VQYFISIVTAIENIDEHNNNSLWPHDCVDSMACYYPTLSNVSLGMTDYSHSRDPFFDRLLWVDLIMSVSNVRPPVHTSVRPQKCSSISMKFGIYVEVDEWRMTVCSMTRSKVKVTSPRKSEIRPFLKAISSPIYNWDWQMTTYS